MLDLDKYTLIYFRIVDNYIILKIIFSYNTAYRYIYIGLL